MFVSSVFRLAFLLINSISFRQFRKILSQTLTHFSTYLFLFFVVNFLFFIHIALSFLFWHFQVFWGLFACFLTTLFLLYVHQILDIRFGTTIVFFFYFQTSALHTSYSLESLSLSPSICNVYPKSIETEAVFTKIEMIY